MNFLDLLELSRRTAIGAGIALPAMSLPVIAASTASDPIFAAMKRHTDAEEAYGKVLGELEDIEVLVPRDRRQSRLYDDHITMAAGDDPRWIENLEKQRDSMCATERRADDLLEVKPTTVAGLVTLLRFAYAFEAGGGEWPNGGRRGCFLAMLCKHAADSIELLSARA